jgi:Arc/MetJ-type ribon-helix-helix transcriptional regulator
MMHMVVCMARVTVTIDDEHEAILKEIAGEEGPYSSKSEAVRELIEKYDKTRTEVKGYESRIQEYEQRVDYLETQVNRLQRTNLKILEERDRNTELEVYVDERREWKQAGMITRTKWWLLGMDK